MFVEHIKELVPTCMFFVDYIYSVVVGDSKGKVNEKYEFYISWSKT